MKGIRGKPKPYRRHAAGDHECRRLGDRPGLRGEELRCVLSAGLAHLARRDRSRRSAPRRTRRARKGREIGCYTVGVVTCRPTKKEAEEYFHHCIVEHADWSAVDGILALKNISPQTVPMQEYLAQAQPIRPGHGRPADRRRSRSRRQRSSPISAKAGLTGIAISLVNYLDELPYFCDEVIGRLERMGLREKVRSLTSFSRTILPS